MLCWGRRFSGSVPRLSALPPAPAPAALASAAPGLPDPPGVGGARTPRPASQVSLSTASEAVRNVSANHSLYEAFAFLTREEKPLEFSEPGCGHQRARGEGTVCRSPRCLGICRPEFRGKGAPWTKQPQWAQETVQGDTLSGWKLH